MFGLSLKTTAAAALFAIGTPAAVATPSEAELAFKNFVAKYERTYQSPEEEATRFRIFETNFKHIKAQNANGKSFFLVINEFADQAPQEFNSTHFGLSVPSSTGKLWLGFQRLGVDEYSGAPLPTSIDWSHASKNAVTTVKNQGSCGSCWTFSTTGALEGAWKIKTGKLLSLSQQQLVDCSKGGNNGCSGGSMDTAFDYLKDHNACTESSYPYTGKEGTCQELKTCDVGIPRGAITGYYDVPVSDTKALMEAVAQQPVSVGIEADQTNFQAYGGGVLTKTCGTKLDHGVLLVGYGTSEDGVDYWKVKNSWGANWGENGFIRLERGVSGEGECGINSMASYPYVANAAPPPVPSPPPLPSPTPRPSPRPAPTPVPPTPSNNGTISETVVV